MFNNDITLVMQYGVGYIFQAAPAMITGHDSQGRATLQNGHN